MGGFFYGILNEYFVDRPIRIEKMNIMRPRYIRASIVFSCLIFFSCRQEENEATKAAKEFCNCMQQQSLTKHFLSAHATCDSELFPKYRLYKIERLYLRYYETQSKIPSATKDSVWQFAIIMDHYTHDNCCKVVLTCPPDTSKKTDH